MNEFNIIFEKQLQKSRLLRNEKISERASRIRKILRWTLKNRERIIEAVKSDLGKPKTEAEISEVYTVTSEARYVLSNLRSWSLPKKVPTPLPLLGTQSKLIKEPKGVCLIISPWNFPFNLTIIPLISCLAAGNTAIVKPSEFSPKSSQLIEEMICELFTEDIAKVINGDVETSQQLLELPFHHIFFTGSPQVGKVVMAAAAKHLSGVTLELGGKNPVFISPEASIDDAAKKIIWAKFMNCGQSCVSPDYVWVEAGKEKELINRMKYYIHKLYNNGQDDSSYGKIVNEKHFLRLENILEESKKEGAQIESEGVLDKSKKHIPLTLITGLKPEHFIMREEIFGPLLPVLTYSHFSEALNTSYDLPKPLVSYLFTNGDKYKKIIQEEFSAGALVINDCLIHFVNPELPFGGVNFSGMGKSHGHFGFKEFTNEKAVMTQLRGTGTSLFFHPPFGGLKRLIVDVLIRWF
ncbi:MAG: aldehyde dehydrogenase family protein [Cyclobacteriaceae bacterium]|nr:aldehyde dehydrogenase family protein [Cyclobacteriaceae bacterium]